MQVENAVCDFSKLAAGPLYVTLRRMA